MKKLVYTFLFLLITAPFLNAQDTNLTRKPILFEGKIINSDSLQQPLHGVNLIVNNSKGVATDINGTFSMLVSANDSIKFTHVGFHPFIIYISDSIVGGKFTATFLMVSDTINLEQYFVWSKGNYHDFKTSFLNMEVKPDLSLIRAKNNIFLSLYEAKTTSANWTAEDNQKNAIKQEENKVVYKGQIPPEQMLNVNILTISGSLSKILSEKSKENDFYLKLLNLQNQNNLIYTAPK